MAAGLGGRLTGSGRLCRPWPLGGGTFPPALSAGLLVCKPAKATVSYLPQFHTPFHHT